MIAITTFLSAFLLFLVQPLIGKYILPWFGGTPNVWTTCMLFFQMVLLAGYIYAHVLTSRCSQRWQVRIHIGLLVLSLVAMPITPGDWLKPTGQENPTFAILKLLALTVGLPYLLVSTTGPLVQRWFSLAYPGRSPYVLYALSNIGSLLALLCYPLLVEPSLRLKEQTWGWSGGYLVFAVLCSMTAWVTLQRALSSPFPSEGTVEALPRSTSTWGDWIFWTLLSMAGSSLMLATTNQLCQDVAVVPFLWIIPLTLYLLSFIICFASDSYYSRRFWAWAAFAAIVALVVLPGVFEILDSASGSREDGVWSKATLTLPGYGPTSWSTLSEYLSDRVWSLIVIYCTVLAIGLMIVHGELARAKPRSEELTAYYMCMSIGGALGGLFVGLVAPSGLFLGYWEYPLALGLAAGLFLVILHRDPGSPFHMSKSLHYRTALYCLLAFVVAFMRNNFFAEAKSTRFVDRNFYGLLRVRDMEKSWGNYRLMLHGRIIHGMQFSDPNRELEPNIFFTPTSAIGQVFTHHPARKTANGPGLKVGVIGLGAGTLACYGKPNDRWIYYEIDPLIVDVANKYFTFLSASPAKIETVVGDARISLERAPQSEQFDVLVVDAFAGDAIPVHLLTKECSEIYWRHLKPDGVLAIHISNRYVNLYPVVQGLAQLANKTAISLVDIVPPEKEWANSSMWALITDNRAILDIPSLRERAVCTAPGEADVIEWTDDFSNLVSVLRE